jgi:predicted alpha/beta hydrolase family esterase
MKRVVIVHCWEGTPEYCWYPWLRDELRPMRIHTFIPQMPETQAPKLDRWLPALQEVIGEPDEELVLVGHSIGCATIMRYLETLKEGEKIAGVVLVAGFSNDLTIPAIKTFFETTFNWEKIKQSAEHVVAIFSDNDPYVPVSESEILNQNLGAELIEVKNGSHFSGSSNCTELPEVRDAVELIYDRLGIMSLG